MIIKNKVDRPNEIQQLFDICNSSLIAYYWNENQVDSDNIEMSQYSGFTHMLYKDGKINSDYYAFFYPLIEYIADKEQIKIKALHRLQINMLLNINVSEEEIKNSIHRDMEDPKYKTIIYYINDSDGDTVIYDEYFKIVDSIKPLLGNYVIFNSNSLHSATIPKHTKKRMVVNCVIEV